VLYEDKAKGEMTCLLKWEPGATLPLHKHVPNSATIRTSLVDPHTAITQKSDFQRVLDDTGIVKRCFALEFDGKLDLVSAAGRLRYPALSPCYHCLSRISVLRRPGR